MHPSIFHKCNQQSHIVPDLLSNNVDVVSTTPNNNAQQWHAKLRHPTFHVLKHVLNKIRVSCSNFDLAFSDSCKLGKLHQLPFSSCPITATHPLELVYADVWGPTPILSIEGFRYYLILVDAYSRYSWLYPLKLKSNVLSTFIAFHKLAELQYNFKLKSLQTDNGGEFKVLLPYLRSSGI